MSHKVLPSHAEQFVSALNVVLSRADVLAGIERLARGIEPLRSHGRRLFILGVGGGAANAAHAVNDFRKLCNIEAYAPTDSVSEITARANDEGWSTVFKPWLQTSRLSRKDALLIFSVGGGTETVSPCLTAAIKYARSLQAKVFAVVGKADGFAARRAHAAVVTGLEGPLLTPVTETVQLAVLHILVSDPRLQIADTKW